MQSHSAIESLISLKNLENAIWEEIEPYSKKQKHKLDLVTAMINKAIKDHHGLIISVGRNITDKMNLKHGDRVRVLRTKELPFIVKIVKSPDDTGYKVSFPTQSNAARIGLRLTGLTFSCYRAEQINHEVQKDKSLIVNLASVIEFNQLEA